MDISTLTPERKIQLDHIKELSHKMWLAKQEIHRIVVGQESAVHYMLLALLCKSHVLLEGLPGVAKTTMIKALAQTLFLDFKRIQFTPDLLPLDIIGTLIFNPQTNQFETKKGPIFAHIILADEMNRAPAKVQSALLEAMQEKQVTIGNQTFVLDEPFIVCATQNPLEQEGTYRLPEAQVDRFLFKILVEYPTKEQEKYIIAAQKTSIIKPLLSREELLMMYGALEAIYVDDRIIDYIVNLVCATRDTFLKYLIHGASPRATLALFYASRAQAFMEGRAYVIPDDVKNIIVPVLSHRLTLQYNAELEGLTAQDIIKQLIACVPVP